jgi:hypothetical protein
MDRPMKPLSMSLSLIAALLALSPTLASAQRAPSPRVIKCEGPFGRTGTHADVVKAFASDNVVYQDIDGAEGEKIKATIVYPNDPKARLEIIWSEEQARSVPIVRVKDQSAWALANGLRVGMTLADVEKMNRKPFKLSGFGWDYGGWALDWDNGALGRPQPGGCLIGAGFTYSEGAPEPSLNKVSGENEFASNNPDMRAVKPVVSVVTISYQQR